MGVICDGLAGGQAAAHLPLFRDGTLSSDRKELKYIIVCFDRAGAVDQGPDAGQREGHGEGPPSTHSLPVYCRLNRGAAERSRMTSVAIRRTV